MILDEYRIVFLVVGGILMLLVVSPVLSMFLSIPRTEFFSEFWLLGSNQRAEEYPFNVTVGGEYKVFSGIGNRLGHAAYYKVLVKFRNQTQSGPDSFNRTASTLPALYDIRAFVADEDIWEIPLVFSLNYDYDEFTSQIQVFDMTLNDAVLSIKDVHIGWDPVNSGFYGNLFFELWIYNATLSDFQYHQRFVGLWLNMTTS